MINKILLLILAIVFTGGSSGISYGQGATYTGTAVIYGTGTNTRTVTRTFTLNVNGQTSKEDSARYLKALEDGGQYKLREVLKSGDLGRFSLGSSLGNQLEAVVIDEVEGKTRVRAVFERWIGFGELRGGYRSVDYPFGYIEILIDPRTGKGEGTFIPAAQIRFRSGKNGAADTVEIEDFGTFPSRLIAVTQRGVVRN